MRLTAIIVRAGAVLLGVSCSVSEPLDDQQYPAAAVGSYDLIAVNGQAVPFAFNDPTPPVAPIGLTHFRDSLVYGSLAIARAPASAEAFGTTITIEHDAMWDAVAGKWIPNPATPHTNYLNWGWKVSSGRLLFISPGLLGSTYTPTWFAVGDASFTSGATIVVNGYTYRRR